jgi:hypothetical protein
MPKREAVAFFYWENLYADFLQNPLKNDIYRRNKE